MLAPRPEEGAVISSCPATSQQCSAGGSAPPGMLQLPNSWLSLNMLQATDPVETSDPRPPGSSTRPSASTTTVSNSPGSSPTQPPSNVAECGGPDCVNSVCTGSKCCWGPGCNSDSGFCVDLFCYSGSCSGIDCIDGRCVGALCCVGLDCVGGRCVGPICFSGECSGPQCLDGTVCTGTYSGPDEVTDR